jgi:hypothetical protein
MARDIQTIIDEMDAAQTSETNLASLNSTSKTAIYTLWKSITATVINYVEQLWDIFKTDLETIVNTAPVGSDSWLSNEILKFQYSATVPQVLEIIDYSAQYPTTDTTLQIISRVSVTTLTNKIVSVKVATSEPPVALSGLQLTSLEGYIEKKQNAGIQVITNSYSSDKFFLKATINYDGQYAAVISANVIAAIELYFSELPFDGIIKILRLEDYIQNVAGVTDIIIDDAAIRPDTVAFGSKTYLIQTKTLINPTYPTYAGYVEQETTAGQTFADQLTFTAS